MGNLCEQMQKQFCYKQQVKFNSESQLSRQSIQVTPEMIDKMRDQAESLGFKFDSNIEIASNDIWMRKLLGRGSFGKVYLISINGKLFAMKQIRKKLVISKLQLENLLYERHILQQHEHPFLVQMYFAYQDPININFVMEFVQGGELFYHLKARKYFDVEAALFYASQIILVLEFLHNTVQIVYRDLKPENILIQKDGYIKLSDMGLAKSNKNICYSFCGTDEYLSPEMILEKGHGVEVDVWAFGCILYEMIYGQSPFKSENQKQLYTKIQQTDYQFPKFKPNHIQELANEVIKSTLVYDPKERPTIKDLKEFKYFQKINFDEIMKKNVKPPFIPIIMTEADTRNFEYVLESQMTDSRFEINNNEQDLFKDFPVLQRKKML